MRTQTYSKLFFAGTLLTILVGCGRAPESSSVMDASTAPRPIAVIAMGGNMSCVSSDPRKMEMASSVMQFIQAARLSTGVDPNYLISCHDFGSDLFYVTNFEPNTVRRAPLEQAYDLARDVSGGKLDLYMMGHSYGGWMTLNLAKALGDEGKNISFLATIDPISRTDCFFNKPIGCLGWPKDIGPDMRTAIAQHTRHWTNFYQTKTFFLHSAPADEADENIKINKGHIGIEHQPEVWKAISAVAAF